MARVLARLAFELKDVEFTYAAGRPEIGRHAHLRDRSAIQIERQALNRARAKIPAGDDGMARYTTQRFDHGCNPHV